MNDARDRPHANRDSRQPTKSQIRSARETVHAIDRGDAAIVSARIRARFRDGDPDAARIVYQTYGQLVYAVAYRALGHRDLAEEATQQTFVKAWRAAASFDPTKDLGPWLAAIARRVAIDVYRHEASRATNPARTVPAIDASAASLAPSLDHLHAIWEVRRAVSELPEEERKVVHRQHFQGLTHSQIASQLGVPVGTVKSRSFRAHKRLIAALSHIQ
ncbi:MAG: sigma-70 family RNA polymerase sigma factor [Solirubrobacterales bacterium]|nr:sigma-70 family RNA polymerase sigma factor [Solirubrobacterales bacterium]